VKYDLPPENSSDLLRFRLQRALGAHCYDGTEAHGFIDDALNGANPSPSQRIKLKQCIEAQYRGSIQLDAAIEVVTKLVEDGEIP
jgi:hypothetical protein